MKLSQKISELLSGHDSPFKFSEGHNSIKNVRGETVFVFCTSSDALYLFHVSENIPKGFRVIEWTWFPY